MFDSISKSAPRRRVLNPRAAIIMVVLVVGVTYGLRKIHDKQFSRTLTFLRTGAMQHLEKKNYRDAQVNLTQYLAFNPSDMDARERLSWILSEQVRTRTAMEQAMRHNEDLLRKGYGSDELRLRQARIASRLHLMSDAEAHLKPLQVSQSDNAEVWYLSGQCAEAARDTQTAIACYKRSIRCAQPTPEAFAALARLADHSTPEEFTAPTLLARMIKQCPTAQAFELSAKYHIDQSRYALAVGDLWKALEATPVLNPGDTVNNIGDNNSGDNDSGDNDSEESGSRETLLAKTSRLNAMLANALQNAATDTESDPTQRRIDLQRAAEHFGKAVQQDPKNANTRLYLVSIQQQLGLRSESMRTLEDGIQQNPRAFSLHTALIDHLLTAGEVRKAQRIFESVPTAGLPREVGAYCRGRILMAEKKWKEAISCFEEAIGFSRKGSGILSRAQLSLALCRSHGKDASATVDTFRSVVADNPESVPARLGMAAAWAKAGQIEFAIAEYRELMDVPGVPAYLADLLIQKTAQQSLSLRKWDEVDELLREQNPAIPDPVQRILLRADRLFASGRFLAAVNTLETARVRYPKRPQITTALNRVHTKYAEGFQERLQILIADEPLNAEARAAVVRDHLASADLAAALSAIDQLTTGQAPLTSQLSIEMRLLLGIETLQKTITLERRAGRDTFVAPLEDSCVKYSRTLAQTNPAYERQMVTALVRSGRTEEAIQFLKGTPGNNNVADRAEAIVELVRSSTNRETVLPIAMQQLYQLITRSPEAGELRMCYADVLLYAARYDLAEETLKPLSELPALEADVAARRAWLRAAQGRDLSRAEELANHAIRVGNGRLALRECQARVFVSNRQFEDALNTLQLIPLDQLSLAGQIYRITALLNLGREAEATVALERIHVSETDILFPADKELLLALNERIRMPATEETPDSARRTQTASSDEI